MLYAICTRKPGRTAEGRRVFTPARGGISYLVAPDDAEAFTPDHQISGPRASATWVDGILDFLPEETVTIGGKSVKRRTGDIVFFVHGYATSPGASANMNRTLSRRLRDAGFPHVFVSFDWPSDGAITNYAVDYLDAAEAAPDLIRSGISLFASFSEPTCDARVHVIAHSMGAYVVRTAFDQVPLSETPSRRAWIVNQLVLVAADIGAETLAGDKSARMLDRALRTTNYFSGYDLALATSNAKRLMTSPRAGRWGAPADARDRIADVDCSHRYRALARTEQDGNAFERSHCWYWNDLEVFIPDLVETLRGDVDRRLQPRRRPDPDNPGRLLLE